jgi:hypothetical protein
MPHHVSRSKRHAGRLPARVCLSLLVLAALTCTAGGQTSPGPAAWDGWQFLLGEWVGEGSGDPGQGSGGFTLLPDLQNTVLVRKNHAEYPAANDRPAFSHDDLMVIYDEHDSLKAVYFDNEKHVIHYSVAFLHDSSAVVFLSEPRQSAPRYRLTYSKRGVDAVGLTFDIAPPGTPEAFTRYINATARRKK